MDKKITVVVPVYNVEKYLSKCLESILAQNFDNYEVVIVNDGSTDNSLEIAQKYEKQYPAIIRVISQKNKGLGGARNTGIRNAKGEYILFVDSDDTIKQGMLSNLYYNIKKEDGDIIFFGMEYIDENGKVIDTRLQFDDDYSSFTLEEQPFIFSKDSYICDKMYKLSLFIENNIFFPENAWYEDLWTEPKLILHTKKMVFTKKIFYEYLQREGSIMHNSNVGKNIDMIFAVKDIIEYYKQEGVFEKYYKQLEFLTIFHVMTLCTLRVASENPNHELLKRFYDFSKEQFPKFKSSKTIKELSKKYRIVFKISCMKQYWILWGMSKVYSMIKK